MLCGNQYPIQYFDKGQYVVNDERDFHTISKLGSKRAGDYKFGCGNTMCRELGIHLCHNCDCNFTKKRTSIWKDQIATSKKNYEKSLKNLHDAKVSKSLTKAVNDLKKYKKNYDDRVESTTGYFELNAGKWEGERLRMTAFQGDMPVQCQPKDCILPVWRQLTWLKKDGSNEIIYNEQVAEKNGDRRKRTTNGCDKLNRLKLKTENEIGDELRDAFAELEQEEEEEIRREKLMQTKREGDKTMYA